MRITKNASPAVEEGHVSRATSANTRLCDGEEKLRIAIVAPHPVQYHTPLYAAVAASGYFDSEVLYLDNMGVEDAPFDPEFCQTVVWDIPLLVGHKFRFLRNYTWRRGAGFFSRINPGIFTALARGRFEFVLIQGYSLASNWLTLLAANALGKRVIWRGEVVEPILPQRPSWLRSLKDRLIRSFLRSCDALLYTCEANRRFLESRGVDPDAMFPLLCAVDNKAFLSAALTRSERDAQRRAMGIEDSDLVVLFSGRLIHRKRIMDVAAALAACEQNNVVLVVMGNGPLRSDLEDYCRVHSVRLINLGFLNQSSVAGVYSIADVLALVSEYDPSPKALNEAMNFGVVPIVSTAIGTGEDLVLEGKTGFVVGLGDTLALARRIDQLAADAPTRARMAKAASRHVLDFSFDANVEGLRQACLAARTRRANRCAS